MDDRSVVPEYLQAVGASLRLGDGEIAAELARAYADLRARQPQVKAFVSHYPRADLPGNCIGIQTVLHDLPDPMVETDVAAAEEFARQLRETFQAPGKLLEIRQVWQLEGLQPRLIEATIELTDQFERLMGRDVPQGFFGDADVDEVTCDLARGGHFRPFGGGARRGVIFIDRSFGIGSARPWSAAYRLRPVPEVQVDLAPEVVEELKRFVSRF